MKGARKMWAMIAVFVSVFLIACLTADAKERESWEEYIEEVCERRSICPELIEAIIEENRHGFQTHRTGTVSD